MTDLFFDDPSPGGRAGRDLVRSLRAEGLGHAFVGVVAARSHAAAAGVASAPLHRQRLEVCLQRGDIERFAAVYDRRGFQCAAGQRARCFHVGTGVEIALLASGEVVGDGIRQSAIRWPDPGAAEWLAGVPVPPLPRLIELFLATWDEGDWREAGRLAQSLRLDAEFAERLHPHFRGRYLECIGQ